MPTVLVQTPVNQPTGTHDYGPVNMPDSLAQATVRLARCTTATPSYWPNTSTRVSAQVLMSFDGGITFPHLIVGFSATGGIIYDKDGNEIPESNARTVDMPGGLGRKVKATVSVTNGPWVSQLTVEAT